MPACACGGRTPEAQTHGWVRVEGMHFFAAQVGVHAHEHGRDQSIEVDVGFWLPTAQAAQSDTLGATLDWSAVRGAIDAVLRRRHYGLIETLCEALAAHLLESFTSERLQLRVCKPGCLSDGRASVAVERWAQKKPACP